MPIQTGSGGRFCALSDRVGDNIAGKNDSFCELTALYWIWKNTAGQDYIGLFHYRRHLSFSPRRQKVNKWGHICRSQFDKDYIENNALTDAAAAAFIAGYDIIMPEKLSVSAARCGKTVAEHYAGSLYHFAEDYQKAFALVKEKYPDYTEYCDLVSRSDSAYFCNMFIMRRALFDQYCSWLFAVLFALEERICLTGRSAHERRVFGYLSERLFNVFLLKLQADNPDLKIKTAQRTLIKPGKNQALKKFCNGLLNPAIFKFVRNGRGF